MLLYHLSFFNKHIKCKHNGLSCLMYLEFLSCRPVATAIIKFNSHLGFTTTHPWNPYSAHVITWNSNGAQCFKYWRKQKKRQLLNKHVKSENDGICCGMWHIVRWAHENKWINKKKRQSRNEECNAHILLTMFQKSELSL